MSGFGYFPNSDNPNGNYNNQQPQRRFSQPGRGNPNGGGPSGYGQYPHPPHPQQGERFNMAPAGNLNQPPIVPTSFGGPTPFGVAPPPARILVSAVNPGPVYATHEQLDVAFGYGMPRDDGTYTRLLRADYLPPAMLASLGIPERQGSEGLMILAPPRQQSPSRRTGPMPTVPADLVSRLPVYNPHGPQGAGAMNSMDAILAQNVSPTGQFRPRREKLYCDKWIHEGICAFTQMGCRYKHEMPLDKATQVSVGLNHGLPAWYKNANQVNLVPARSGPASQPPPPTSPAVPANRVQENWRREFGMGGGYQPMTTARLLEMASPQVPYVAPRSFGPIGPPPPSQPSSSRPTAAREEGELSSESDDDDDGAGTLLFRGRNNPPARR